MFKNLLKSTAIALALAITTSNAQADIADGKFSINQIFDVQYYWSGNTLNASNFIAPYDQNFQHPSVTAGQYFQFFSSTTNPGTYGLGLYNADGTLSQVVHDTGTLSAIGPDALFYLGSGFFGTVITTSAGYSYGANANFTNMDTSVSAADTSAYTWASTTPLASGQTASSGGGGTPAPNYVTLLSNTNITTVNPTSNNSPAGEGATKALDGNPNTKYLNFDRANAGFTIKLDTPRVIRGVTFTTANDFVPRDPSKFSLFGSNDGVNWTTIVNAQVIALSDNRFTTTNRIDITNNDAYFYYFITFPSIKAIDTYGSIAGCQAALGTLACDSVQIGDVAYYYDTTYTTYTVPTDGGTGTIANPGTAGSNSSLAPPGPQPVVNISGSTASNPTGAAVTTVTNAGTYTNNGTATNITNTGNFTNNGTAGDVTNSGTFTNSILGTIANLVNNLFATNNGTITGTVTNNAGATFDNTGTVQGATTNAGTINNSGIMDSITNSGTVNNTGTTGAVTNNTGGIFNNDGSTGSVTNAATFNNRGTTGIVDNSGMFTNFATGTTGAFTNTGTLVNAGNIASLNNSGTASNDGTIIGDVTNNGTFANGIIGTITNLINNLFASNDGSITGTVNNNAGGTFTNNGTIQGVTTNAGTVINTGTMAALTNSGTFTNSGTTGAVNNIGTFNSNGSSGALTNSGTATIDGNGSIASATNTGTLNITGAASSGDIFNLAGGLLDFNGTGSLGNIDNAGVFNFAGSGAVSSIINSGTSNISGSVTTGNITNSGIINFNTANANVGAINNTGVLNLAAAGGNFTSTSYTQTSTGLTAMSGLQQFNIVGPAALGGSMMIINSPTAFGRYPLMTAQSMNGTYDSLIVNPSIEPLGAYLKYGTNNVLYYVTPSDAATRASLAVIKHDQAKMNNIVTGRTAGALGNDCVSTGAMGGCVGFSFGTTKNASGDLRSGSVVVSTRLGQVLSDNYRIGIFLDKPFTNPTVGSVKYKDIGPIVGGFIGWNQNLNNSGLGIVASVARNDTGNYIVNRPQWVYAEAGSAIVPIYNTAYQVKASYSVPVYGSIIATPYLGIRYSELSVKGFTESGPVFPLSINAYKQTKADLLGGVSFAMPITDKITASISAGVVHNLASDMGSITGTSEIYRMNTFNIENPGKKYTSGSLGAGVSYEFIPNHKIGVNVGWQQKSLIDASVGSVGSTYSYGF